LISALSECLELNSHCACFWGRADVSPKEIGENSLVILHCDIVREAMENIIDEEAEIEVDFGDDADEEYEGDLTGLSPDDFFAKYAKRVIYQTNHFFLPQIRSMIADGEAINLQPEYQRRLRWTTKQKSLLIESLLLNIPIPAVYFYESDLARYEVMDGQQRLSAISSFFNNEFKLSGLTVLAPLNGLSFKSCPPRVTRALERASVSAIVLLLAVFLELEQFLTIKMGSIGSTIHVIDIIFYQAIPIN